MSGWNDVSQRPEDDRRAVLRVEYHEHPRRVHVRRRQPELAALKHHGQGDLGLHERQVLADAHPRAAAERHERHLRPRLAVAAVAREAPGVELRGVGAPHVGVVVHGHDGNHDLRARRHHAAAELHVPLRLPDHGHRRRVEPERLVDDHPERPEPGEVVLGGDAPAAADVDDLPASTVLPLRVHGERDGGPGEEAVQRLQPGEEEVLGLLDDLVRRHGRGHEAHEVPHAAGARVPAPVSVVVAALQAGDELSQESPDLPVELPHAPVPPGGQEPVARDEDLAVRLGGVAGVFGLQPEHGAALVAVAAERGDGDGLLRQPLVPLNHVHLHLAGPARRRRRR